MKHTRKAALALSALALFASMAAGCSAAAQSPAEETTHTCFVVSNAANSPTLGDSAQTLVEELALNDGDSVSVIVADGRPELLGSLTVDLSSANNPEQKKQRLELIRTDLATSALNTAPNDSEVDLVAALQLAARTLQDKQGRKQLILALPLLSTTGVLNMAEEEDLFMTEPAAAAQKLTGYAPTMKGVTVQAFFPFDPSGIQPALNATAKTWLTDFWTSYLVDQCGAANLQYAAALPTGQEPDTAVLPPVSVIAMPEEKIGFTDLIDRSAEEGTPVALTENQVAFLPDSVQLKDPAQAGGIFKEVASAMARHEEVHYLVTGTCAAVAGESEEHLKDFSQQRAAAVVEQLIQCGVSPERLTPVGLGALEWSLRADNDEDNRAVYLIPSTAAELTQEVLALAG